jgi:two-component system chemotaxis response regulator CheB
MGTPPDQLRDRGNRDVIVVGGSAGGVEAALALARGLPVDLPAAVLITLHRAQGYPGLLAQILDNAGPLPAVMAEEGQYLERGRIYVAPPDRHLLVEHDHLHVRRGPRENHSRPAIDPLFRSAAATCLTRTIGVLLSGMLNDGTSGLLAIKHCGGLAVVQDPKDAAYPEMPRNALAYVAVDHVLPLAGIAPLLAARAATPPPSPPAKVPEEIRIEALIAAEELFVMPDQHRLGTLSPLTCPECDGSLQEIREDGLVRYRCHTGHAFTLEALRVAAGEAWERTLYGAMRAQQQQAMVVRRMADEARRQGDRRAAEEFERRARDYEEGAKVIQRLAACGGEVAPAT